MRAQRADGFSLLVFPIRAVLAILFAFNPIGASVLWKPILAIMSAWVPALTMLACLMISLYLQELTAKQFQVRLQLSRFKWFVAVFKTCSYLFC